MKNKIWRAGARTATVALVLLALTSCTINIGTPASNNVDNGNGMGGMMGDGMMGNDENNQFSAPDIMFAQMMISHHQQAVDMGTLAETRASNPKVKALAAKIKSEQAPEIVQMKGWLKDANASMTMSHDMGMNGMLDDTELTALEGSSGAAFDRLYLQGMIAHHEGAINMAKMVIDSKNAEVNKLAHSIVSSQTSQIEYMQSLLK